MHLRFQKASARVVVSAPVGEMGEWRLELATAEDDAAIRRLLAANPVPGRIALGFEREPSYFLGCGLMGAFWQVAVARRRSDGEVAAVACRATRPRFVNGRIEEVGYVGQLRVDAPSRGRWLAAGLLRGLSRLHADGRVRGYLATITDENTVARGLLAGRPRRGFPTFRPVDRIHTLAILVRRPVWSPRRPSRGCRIEVGLGTEADLGAIVACLRERGAARQFFPVYGEEDFRGSATTRDFRVEDFVVARRSGRVAGVIGLWDQMAYRQTVVRGYGGALRWARSLYNLGARCLGAASPPLPPPGRRLRAAYASFICVAHDDPGVFDALLRQVYHLAAERGYAYLMVGLAASDPLLRVARTYAHVAYHSTLYTVCLGGDEEFHGHSDDGDHSDGRVPYVEIAAL